MKNRILNLAIIVLVGIACWQGGMLYERHNGDNDSSEVVAGGYGYDDFNLYNEGRNFPVKWVADYKGTALPLDSISGTTDLFVYADMAGCPPCREMTFRHLDEFKENNPAVRITVLLNSIRGRDMYVMEKEGKNRYKYYLLETEPFARVDEDDEALSPVLFRLNADGTLQNCHMVQPYEDDDLKEYLGRFAGAL